MSPRYNIGQKVIITPVHNQHTSPKDSGLEQHAGQIGKVTHYYWLSPNTGEVFYIYTVQIGEDRKEIVLHEDEIEACKT